MCVDAQMSTYALTLFRKEIKLKEDDGASTIIGAANFIGPANMSP
jgi:hypothetical protein